VLEELLGEGSFGSVYKARHKDSGVTMAVKLVVAQNFTEIAQEIEVVSYHGSSLSF
jgi:serine/threonine protein kinase